MLILVFAHGRCTLYEKIAHNIYARLGIAFFLDSRLYAESRHLYPWRIGRNCACQLSYEIEREHGVGEVGDLRV